MNPNRQNEEPPPAGELLEVDEPSAEAATEPAQASDERVFRLDHVIDGFYRGIIASMAIEYWDNRQPTGLHMEHDQALRFAEAVRRHIEANAAEYGAIPITCATFHQAFERVVSGWISRPATAV